MTNSDAESAKANAGQLNALLDLDHPTKAATAQWAREHLTDTELADRDLQCTFWAEGWRLVAERGLLGGLTSPDYGGRGLPLTTALLELEGLGLGCRDDGLVLSLIHI